MAFPENLPDWPFANIPTSHWAGVAAATVIVYSLSRSIYNLYFHPISRYPGPKLAAISNVWYAYNWLTGRWPWKIEEVLRNYGDVVRIAPNELVFLTPEAARDIYLSHEKNLESFVKTDFEDLGEGDGGISFEIDPIKHREVARRLAPAFSIKNFKAKHATLDGYIDLFVDKMREVGGGERGVEMRRWADWLSMDISADMTYNRQMGQMKEMKNSIFLDAAINVNLFGTINQIMKKFPLLSPLMYLFIPPSVWLTMPRVMKINSQEVETRIQRRGRTEHLDYFEQIVPADQPAPSPTDKKHITHLEQIAGQLLVAGWEPVSNQFYSSIFFLLKEPKVYATLVDEVICEISYFAAARSPRYFTEPLEFHPQRWLPPDHPQYDPRFKGDDLKAFMPFNQGPRACPGSAIAWAETRLYLAKVLWTFNLEAVRGQKISFDKDFSFYSMWNKPQFWVRFLPNFQALQNTFQAPCDDLNWKSLQFALVQKSLEHLKTSSNSVMFLLAGWASILATKQDFLSKSLQTHNKLSSN
ncbi:hypothetical protein VPNG_03106 [Cytospora leucostoma]|uniref:Cytochrome P450 n=1 Tax=Cytospora leucostoma TaxID=1230097 RepID=A0A423XG93_9PEZI|nr:hypothetical protein VPNG_03106 [Cytospora leucostoma]